MSREDPGHLFLLSIASLSVVVGGCGGGLPGGTPSSAPIPTDDDDGGLEEQNNPTDPTSTASPCTQYAAISVECFQETGYGYGYGEGGDIVPPDQAYLEAECTAELMYEIAVYGPACGAALSDLYVCLGGLSCEQLLADQAGEECLDAYIRLNDACTVPATPDPPSGTTGGDDDGTSGGTGGETEG